MIREGGLHHHHSHQPPHHQQKLRRTLVQWAEIEPEEENLVRNRESGSFYWKAGMPRNVLFIKKPRSPQITRICIDMISWCLGRGIRAFCEPNAADDLPNAEALALWSPPSACKRASSLGDIIDMVVTVGGDGTMLHANSLFSHTVPPVVPFSMGSLGFLTEHSVGRCHEVLEAAVTGKFTLVDRPRLRCEIHYGGGSTAFPAIVQAMNEVALVRGSPDTMLVCLDVSVNGHKVSTATGDGVIVSSSTGSTAYSLSCGGPMIHPSLDCLLVTPICPRSLSFRPVVLPKNISVELGLSAGARNPEHLVASFDGRSSRLISSHDVIRISVSPYPVPTITGSPLHAWLEATKDLLKWNVSPLSLERT